MRQQRIYFITILIVAFICSAIASAPKDTLRTTIGRIVQQADGRVGVAIIGVDDSDTLTVNGSGRFPMQSVYKFPLALAVLSRVDKGALSLDQRIHLRKEDLLPNTWSPLRDKYPGGDVDVTLDELLAATVSRSDNNGCDILFRLLGGPDTVGRYIHGLGIKEIAIVATEEEMHNAWDVQYRNWCTPHAMARLLYTFDRDSILSEKSKEYLWGLMAGSTPGPRRLKGLLPAGTVVAHKTGLSDTNEKGITAATNDAGIVTLPDGRHVVIAVFVSDSKAGESDRERVIAEIAKAAWDAFSVH